MNRVNLGWFCDLGALLRPLATSQWGDPHETLWSLYRLMRMLEALLNKDNAIKITLHTSRPLMLQLVTDLNKLFAAPEAPLAEFEEQKHDIKSLIARLDVVLTTELGTQPTYHVSSKRAYNIDALVDDAKIIFSLEVRNSLTEAEIYDIAQAGRCLAFEIPTAAAYHIFRAMESTIRDYYKSVVGDLPGVKQRNWGCYIKCLRAQGGDEKIISMLEYIKDMYRNPIIHPELRVELEEALSLIGMAESVISAMKSDIKAKNGNYALNVPTVCEPMAWSTALAARSDSERSRLGALGVTPEEVVELGRQLAEDTSFEGSASKAEDVVIDLFLRLCQLRQRR